MMSYDDNCVLNSLPVWDFENFKHLIFVAWSVPFKYVIDTSTFAQSNSQMLQSLDAS
jgi:hypothetical protein